MINSGSGGTFGKSGAKKFLLKQFIGIGGDWMNPASSKASEVYCGSL